MPSTGTFGPRGYCVLMVRPSESLLHFIQERQYRAAYSDIELLV